MVQRFHAVRPAAVAGKFYPGRAELLRREVRQHLESAGASASVPPKALIAPHAGYMFSGPVAGTGFATWRGRSAGVSRLIVLGPSHYVEFPGLGLSAAAAFATPLGAVPVEVAACEQLLEHTEVDIQEAAHQPEHSLEVELPFVQEVVPEAVVIPLLTGDVAVEAVADVLEGLWGGAETRVVVSSDLSHYLDYVSARRRDAETARAIEAMEDRALHSGDACGCVAIRALLQVARRRGLVARTLDLRNSGDTAGSRDRVVGYGAFGFYEPGGAVSG